ncbi:hypothetical protein C4565_03080 [Candidatus Parcubacteria bacterium]|jgi:hypothetical protein|nr:MAG: hypothetical protein C4565_03080 [Candidatus Parcubacteria bacterium]
MDLGVYLLILNFVGIISAISFSQKTKLIGFHYFFMSLLRGLFAGAVGIWTAIILYWYFGLPKQDGFFYGLLFIQLGILHTGFCLLNRLIHFPHNSPPNNRLKF